jgi:hypothetical protein
MGDEDVCVAVTSDSLKLAYHTRLDVILQPALSHELRKFYEQSLPILVYMARF